MKVLHRNRKQQPITAAILPHGMSYALIAAVPDHMQWRADMVEDRIVEAALIIERIVAHQGPRKVGAAWPEFKFTPEEIAEQKADDVARRSVYSRIKIERMEQAIAWPGVYLADHQGAARVLREYVRCKVYRKSFDQACKAQSWSRATAYRARDRAFAIIAFGLMSDRIAP